MFVLNIKNKKFRDIELNNSYKFFESIKEDTMKKKFFFSFLIR